MSHGQEQSPAGPRQVSLARAVRAALPDVTCSLGSNQLPTFFCSTGIGMLTILPPLVTFLLLFLFRKPLRRGLARILPEAPPAAQTGQIPLL